MRNLVFKNLSKKHKLLFIHDTVKLKDFFRVKERQDLLTNNGVVYRI